MKKSLALLLAMVLTSNPLFALTLDDALNVANSLASGADGPAPAGQEAGLFDSVASQLGVNSQQAIGGAGALLGLAKSQLPEVQYAQLLGAVPGLDKLSSNAELLDSVSKLLGKGSATATNAATDLNSLLNNTQNLNDLDQAFKALGMGHEKIGQFVPLLLGYLGKQGLDQPLLQSLANIWGMPADGA